MRSIGTPQRVSFTGEVVETFERNGTQIAKISLRPLHVELPIEILDAAHLGDKVQLEATLSIQRIEPYIRMKDPNRHSDADL